MALSLWPWFKNRPVGTVSRSLIVSTVAFTAMGAGLGLGITTLGPWVYHYVTGQPSPPGTLFVLFALLLAATSALQPVSMYLTDQSGLLVQAFATVLTQSANLALSWALAPSQGASGVVFASMICVAVVLPGPLFLTALRVSRVRGDQTP
jgi:hypothetical protein